MKAKMKDGTMVEIDDLCGNPLVYASYPPKYRLKNEDKWVDCSDITLVLSEGE